MQRRSVPIVQAYGLTELQLASRVQGVRLGVSGLACMVHVGPHRHGRVHSLTKHCLVQGDEDSDADDDASMGKLMRTYGLFHSIAEGFHIISSSLVRHLCLFAKC